MKEFFIKATMRTLSAVIWENMDNLNVEESWNFFIDEIKNCIDKHVPSKSQIRNIRKKQKWINTECPSSIK